MRDATSIKRPFFWQAVFILLPVTLLSVVSLISLRRDAQRTEEDVHNRAAQNAQSLALAMRASVNDELRQLDWLDYKWTSGLRWGDTEHPSVQLNFPDEKLKPEIGKWEQDYPGLRFADLSTPQTEILTNGCERYPPEIPAVPTPPAWFRELSPKQEELWGQLRHAIDANESAHSIQNASQAFADSGASDEAVTAAAILRKPATEIIGYSNSHPTETGLSFEGIACYRLLSARDAKLTDSLVLSVWRQVIDDPSFISSHLLELAEGLTNRSDPALSQKIYWTRRYWNEESKVRAWLEQLRPVEETHPDNSDTWAAWADGSDAGALAYFMPFIFTKDQDRPGHRNPLGRGYVVRFVPREVVQAIFSRALQENKVFIPDYEAADVTVEEKPIASFPISDASTNLSGAEPSDWLLLGTASQKAGLADSVNFAVNLYLTSRAQMLSAEHRRFRLFSMLILGALFSALVGLIAAWQAFFRQQKLNEMKINFVSSVSHELRAPIASVRLMAENLERGKIPDAPRQNEYFRFIVQECRRLSSLIENVLDFSRIEQGRKQYEFEPANLVALVQTTVKLMEPYAAEKGVRLEMTDVGASNIEMEVDGRAIQQALVNLIDNAIKHSPKGETVTTGIELRNGEGEEAGSHGSVVGTSRCDVPARRAGGTGAGGRSWSTVILFVADHGPGIPPEEHEKIFERFYRRGSELRRETQGVGIGLSVVQHIVEGHGGHVRVQSEPGKGCRFTIELPIKTNE